MSSLCCGLLMRFLIEKLMNVDDMIQRRIPRVLQYGVIQMIFFVMGIILSFGVIQETGFFVLVRESFGSLFNDRMFIGRFSNRNELVFLIISQQQCCMFL